jgi:predicted metal-binding protein
VSAVTLHVCTTCRGAGDDEARPGRALLAEIERELARAPRPGLAVEAVECLSVCKRPCTVALTSPGRWTYVYGGLDPATAAGPLLAGAGLYAGTPDGIVPWRERPDILKKGVVARIPPLALPEAAE